MTAKVKVSMTLVVCAALTSLSKSCSPCPLSVIPHPHPSSALRAPRKVSSSSTGVCRGAVSEYCAYMRAEGEEREESRDITQVNALDPKEGGTGDREEIWERGDGTDWPSAEMVVVRICSGVV
jgi:hypothetical protein